MELAFDTEHGYLSDHSDSSFDDDEYDSDECGSEIDEEYIEEISEEWYDHDEEYYDEDEEWYEYLYRLFFGDDSDSDSDDDGNGQGSKKNIFSLKIFFR